MSRTQLVPLATCFALATIGAGEVAFGAAPPTPRPGKQANPSQLWSEFPLHQGRTKPALRPQRAERRPKPPALPEEGRATTSASRSILIVAIPGMLAALALTLLIGPARRRRHAAEDTSATGQFRRPDRRRPAGLQETPQAPPEQVQSYLKETPQAAAENAHGRTSSVSTGQLRRSDGEAGGVTGKARDPFTRQRKRSRSPSDLKETPQAASQLAFEAIECDKFTPRQSQQRSTSVSEQPEVTSDESPRAGTESAAAETGMPATTYADIGERVAGVLRAAEEAAGEIKSEARKEAESYVRDTREAVNSYASQRRREAEEVTQKILTDAEGQARATREAAEQMAKQIEGTARQRQGALREESRTVEARLQRALAGFRQITERLEELLEAPLETDDDGSVAQALELRRQRQTAG
jgi:hypothetical protein